MRDRSGPGRPTLMDVAREAGVSPMTVSRVVRETGMVGGPTRAAVERAIAAVGYVPNSAARGLRGTRTGTIGLIVPDMTNPYFTTLAHGVETAARKAGIMMILANSDERDTEERRLVGMLISKQVDGLLVAPARSGIATMRLCRARGTDLVFVDRRPKGSRADVVRADAEGGAFALGRHLSALGHLHTAILTGPASVSSSEDRVTGFRRAMLDAGATEPLVLHGSAFSIETGLAMAAEAMQARPRPTALFAVNNFIALGVLQALEHMAIRVPEDVTVVGFDDLPAMWLAFPFLTVAMQPAFELGREAVAMLLDRHAHPDLPARELVLPTDLVIRRSSAAPEDRRGGATAAAAT